MANPEPYDFLIIGAGQCAVPLAQACAAAGRRTALVEREHVGGTCVNEGCTPTKTMVASARVAYLARRAADYGIHTNDIRVDLASVRDRKRSIVDEFRGSSERRLNQVEHLDVIAGDAVFTGPKQVAITLHEGGTRTVGAETVIIDAGGRPSIPPIPGLADVPYLTSTTIMELDRVPEHLVVLGGGYIALEFAQMFRRFGSAVTVLERSGRLVEREDDDIAESLTQILTEDGIAIRTDVQVTAVRGSVGEVAVEGSKGGAPIHVTGSHLLVAVGRRPNTDTLGCDAAGITLDARSYIPVDECLQTNVAGVYAVGDINGGPAFTHISYDDYRILKANLLDAGAASTAGRMVPYVLFTDPQLGRVGLTEAQGRKAGLSIKVASMPMNYVARALETDESRGLMKAVVDASTEKILGCAVLGIEGGEIMSALQIAMMAGLPYPKLRDGIFAHPTLMESLNNLFTYLK